MRSLLDFFEEFATPTNTMGMGNPVAPIGDAIGSGDVVSGMSSSMPSSIPSSKIEKAKRKRKSKSSSSVQSPVRRS